MLRMWWLNVGDVVAQCSGCGGSMLGMWWLYFGDVVAQCWGYGGSMMECDGSIRGSGTYWAAVAHSLVSGFRDFLTKYCGKIIK